MSRPTAGQIAGRKAWINTLVKQGKHEAATAYARKHRLVDWLSGLSGLSAPSTISVMSTSDVNAPLPAQPVADHSPTLPPASTQASAADPGGAAVAESTPHGNGDSFPRKCENPQLRVGVGLVPAAWPDAVDAEPEMLEAIAAAPKAVVETKAEAPAAPTDSRCATLTDAGRPSAAPCEVSPSGLGRQDPDPKECAREGFAGQILPVKAISTLEEVTEANKRPWPEEGEATIVRELPNRSLMMVKLEDGRLVSMWRQGRKWEPKGRVRVKIQKRDGDPIYEPA